MKAVHIITVLYAVGLAAFTGISLYSLYINPNTFYPVINIVGYIIYNPLILAAVVGGAGLIFILLIWLSLKSNKPKEPEYTPVGTPKTSTGYNPQPTQPTEYIPRGQTITDTTSSVKEKVTSIKDGVESKTSAVKEAIKKIADSS